MPFARLIERVVEGVAKGEVSRDELLVQYGYTPIKWPESERIQSFLSASEYQRAVGTSTCVVTHAGTGSIIRALKASKPLIVAPRRVEYGEHNDNHQVEMADTIQARGWCTVWDLDQMTLGEVLQQARGREPVDVQFDWPSLVPPLRSYIEGLDDT